MDETRTHTNMMHRGKGRQQLQLVSSGTAASYIRGEGAAVHL
eukprot:COSAG05_NODE_5187_length_1242_cov_5.006999_1_plen_41_part_10